MGYDQVRCWVRNLGVVGFRGLELQVVVWAGSRVTVHQNMDDGYKNCPVRAYKKRKQVEDRALKNEEGHTKRPEKYWPERWEDKVGETRLQKCGWRGPQQGVVSRADRSEKVSTDKGL